MRKLLLFIAVFLLLPMAGLAQKTQKDDQFERERQRGEQERQYRELQERIDQHLGGTRFGSGPKKDLLPEGPIAWVLHIVTTGGFTGQGLPTLTIRSTGNFACGEDEALRFMPLDPGTFPTLWHEVAAADLRVDKASPKAQGSSEFACNDCYRTSLYLTRREADGKIRFYRSGPGEMKYASYAEAIDRIKRRAAEFADCSR